jgi:hypothetical protein
LVGSAGMRSAGPLVLGLGSGPAGVDGVVHAGQAGTAHPVAVRCRPRTARWARLTAAASSRKSASTRWVPRTRGFQNPANATDQRRFAPPVVGHDRSRSNTARSCPTAGDRTSAAVAEFWKPHRELIPIRTGKTEASCTHAASVSPSRGPSAHSAPQEPAPQLPLEWRCRGTPSYSPSSTPPSRAYKRPPCHGPILRDQWVVARRGAQTSQTMPCGDVWAAATTLPAQPPLPVLPPRSTAEPDPARPMPPD